MKLIDTHNHLYLEDFDPEQDQLVTIAKESGIDTLLLPNVDTSTIRRMHDLCDRYPDFAYPMMGLHPTSVDEHYAKNLKETESWLGKRVAAGILLVLGLGWGWFHQNSTDDSLLLTQTIQPGSKKAVLTLADGSVWHIGDSAMLISTAQNHIRIDSSGMLLQAGKEEKPESTDTYHLLSIPRGGEFTMTLADGTRVWLNSESELHFPLQFGGKQRKVQLTGEAYFEVAKDAAHPFVVEVCDSKIQVLGTGFNVRSYSEEGQIVTTLVEGTVCFESIEDRVILKPGEQSILDKEGRLQKRAVEVYPFVAWKEGRFIFRKQRLEDIMVMVSRWYNVEVYFEDDESKEITFSGGMMRNDGFEALMKMIETVGSINCTIKDNTVFIAKRK